MVLLFWCFGVSCFVVLFVFILKSRSEHVWMAKTNLGFRFQGCQYIEWASGLLNGCPCLPCCCAVIGLGPTGPWADWVKGEGWGPYGWWGLPPSRKGWKQDDFKGLLYQSGKITNRFACWELCVHTLWKCENGSWTWCFLKIEAPFPGAHLQLPDWTLCKRVYVSEHLHD